MQDQVPIQEQNRKFRSSQSDQVWDDRTAPFHPNELRTGRAAPFVRRSERGWARSVHPHSPGHRKRWGPPAAFQARIDDPRSPRHWNTCRPPQDEAKLGPNFPGFAKTSASTGSWRVSV
jgi:hypothetical protein